MNWLLELLGAFGGLCFAVAAMPTAYRALRTGKHQGTPVGICVATLMGGCSMWTYLYLKFGWDWIIAGTYIGMLLSWSVLLWYAWNERCTKR